MKMQKIWFITGASRGFGSLIAQKAVDRGDAAVATGRNAEHVIKALGEQPELLALPLDVRNEAQAVAAARAAIEHFGRIDVLVNNAGYGLLGAVEEASTREVEDLFATNVFGLLNVTRAVLPYMRAAKSGHIMNLSSIGGYAAHAGWGLYGATKFAVEGISEALSIELAPLGIHSTVVEPGFFRTDFLSASSLVSTAKSIEDYASTVGTMRVFAEGADHQQPGDPARLADALMVIADAKTPPHRLPLGSDSVTRIEQKHRDVSAELNEWRSLALSADFTAKRLTP
jgi:NAD(P)-dependent dehydrogenase (short-subunit alcohol dehydrogenase family)